MNDSDSFMYPPPDDTAMLPWYQGAFSHAYIALHPFFAVQGLNPRSCEHGTLVLEGSERPENVDLLEWMDEKSSLRRKGKEISSGSIADIAKSFSRCIGWREICQETGMQDHCALDRALRTTIMGLRREHEDLNAAKRLSSYCDLHNIFFPTEGAFQPTMEARLVSTFQKAGLSEILVGNEFGDDEMLISLTSLADSAAWETRSDLVKWGARRLIAPDRSLLAWVHWDSFYTAFFGTAERLYDIRVSESFEGFWCSDQTTTYWLMQEALPIVQ